MTEQAIHKNYKYKRDKETSLLIIQKCKLSYNILFFILQKDKKIFSIDRDMNKSKLS